MDLKDPGLIPNQGDFTKISFKEEMNQMVNNKDKNSSNSFVFGRWPQTKTDSPEATAEELTGNLNWNLHQILFL